MGYIGAAFIFGIVLLSVMTCYKLFGLNVEKINNFIENN